MSGKGREPEKGVNWKKYYRSKLWDNLGHNQKNRGKVMDTPVRLCCGQRHNGPVCPDGKVQCCVCFSRFNKEDLNQLSNGKYEDVCKVCAEKDKPKEGKVK